MKTETTPTQNLIDKFFTTDNDWRSDVLNFVEGTENSDFTARLIAAAPDLLAACQGLLMHIGLNAGAGESIKPSDEPLAAVRLAITKATT